MIIPKLENLSNWFSVRWMKRQLPLHRASLDILAQQPQRLPKQVRDCAVAQKYLQLLGPLDWSHFPERFLSGVWPGQKPFPRVPFVAAYLVKLHEQKRYMSDLRRYLVEHPALIWLLGFPLTPADNDWGFDVEASVPSTHLFLSVLRTLDNQTLQFLLTDTIQLIRQALPDDVDFGQAISLDTKHIIGWVKENNPKVFIKEDRYDKTKFPAGDPTCRLGTKKKRNQRLKPTKTPTKQPVAARSHSVSELYWGYGSGVVATKVAGWVEVVLAELTQTFDRNDVTYFFPLMHQVQARLGFAPPYGALDAAFDTWYVFDYFHNAGGLAAVPFSGRGGKRTFDPQGLPLCEANLPMPIKSVFTSRTDMIPHQKARHGCPLLLPEPNGQVCPINHKKWPKGGCITSIATAKGARLRHLVDRDGQPYKALYKQRTATERINSQAVALGIERPKLRNQQAVSNFNTLIYILINLRAFHRVCRQRALPET